jgi:ubiquinone/menaquinone biosynthesis C-methylase UbiE
MLVVERADCCIFGTNLWLSSHSTRSTSVDVKKAAERTQNERLNIQLVHWNVENMPLPTKSFDLVLAESVTVFTDLSKAIHEFARVLQGEYCSISR